MTKDEEGCHLYCEMEAEGLQGVYLEEEALREMTALVKGLGKGIKSWHQMVALRLWHARDGGSKLQVTRNAGIYLEVGFPASRGTELPASARISAEAEASRAASLWATDASPVQWGPLLCRSVMLHLGTCLSPTQTLRVGAVVLHLIFWRGDGGEVYLQFKKHLQ